MTDPQSRRKDIPAERTRRARYRIKNPRRFASVMAVGALMVLAVALALAGNPDRVSGESDSSAQTAPTTAAPATLPPTATPDPVPEGKRETPVRVVVDPGHGGRDPGAVALDGSDTAEKDIVLDVSLQVRDILEAANIPTQLTRSDDSDFASSENSDLIARAAIANEADATLFACVHVNSYDTTVAGGADVDGMEMYYYGTSTAVYDGFSSKDFADIMLGGISGANGMTYTEAREHGWMVLRRTLMPAVLIEIGYITNPADSAKLEDPGFRTHTAEGIAAGIRESLDRIGMFERDGTYYVYKNATEDAQ